MEYKEIINKDFIEVSSQKHVLDKILSDLKKSTKKDNAFIPEKYVITIFNDGFCGRYDGKSDIIYVNKWFLYSNLCTNDMESIKNFLIHEESHRQVKIKGKNSAYADHWKNWLGEYLSMGGSPPQVYVKKKLYEFESGYADADNDIEDIIIITYSRSADEILRKRSKIKKPFLLIKDENIIEKNF